MGLIIAAVSGLLMSVQGVFNTRIQEKAGLWFTNAMVHGIGLVTSLSVLLFVKDLNVSGLKAVNKWYFLGGVFSAGIVYTVMVAISKLGPAQASMIILITQITVSYLIELFGLFDTEKVPFQWLKLLGVGVIITGIILFQWEIK